MPVAFFQVPLSVRSQPGGEAELIPPQSLQEMSYGFVIIKEGAEEGIVRVEGAQSALGRVEEDSHVKRLEEGEVDELRRSYPAPKTKQRFRMRPQPMGAEGEFEDEFETDAEGKRIVETVQTVRSGFYLIDVPLVTSP